MNIVQQAMAGSLESCDCLIVASPDSRLDIQIDSTVGKRFGAHIHALVAATLRELRVVSGQFTVTDRGALDYCIRARVIAATRRGGAC